MFQVVNEIGMGASDEQVKEFCENLLKSGQVIFVFLKFPTNMSVILTCYRIFTLNLKYLSLGCTRLWSCSIA